MADEVLAGYSISSSLSAAFSTGSHTLTVENLSIGPVQVAYIDLTAITEFVDFTSVCSAAGRSEFSDLLITGVSVLLESSTAAAGSTSILQSVTQFVFAASRVFSSCSANLRSSVRLIAANQLNSILIGSNLYLDTDVHFESLQNCTAEIVAQLSQSVAMEANASGIIEARGSLFVPTQSVIRSAANMAVVISAEFTLIGVTVLFDALAAAQAGVFALAGTLQGTYASSSAVVDASADISALQTLDASLSAGISSTSYVVTDFDVNCESTLSAAISASLESPDITIAVETTAYPQMYTRSSPLFIPIFVSFMAGVQPKVDCTNSILTAMLAQLIAGTNASLRLFAYLVGRSSSGKRPPPNARASYIIGDPRPSTVTRASVTIVDDEE